MNWIKAEWIQFGPNLRNKLYTRRLHCICLKIVSLFVAQQLIHSLPINNLINSKITALMSLMNHLIFPPHMKEIKLTSNVSPLQFMADDLPLLYSSIFNSSFCNLSLNRNPVPYASSETASPSSQFMPCESWACVFYQIEVTIRTVELVVHT